MASSLVRIIRTLVRTIYTLVRTIRTLVRIIYTLVRSMRCRAGVSADEASGSHAAASAHNHVLCVQSGHPSRGVCGVCGVCGM